MTDAPVFPVPRLMAYRKTYFARALAEMGGALLFGVLLRQLAPRVFARLRDRSPHACLLALCAYIHKHCFPLQEFALAEIEAADGRDDDEWSYVGIPVCVFGCDWYDEGYDAQESPAIALCLTLSDAAENVRFPVLDQYIGDVEPCRLHEHRNPPRGRVWKSPWGNAWDLCIWAEGQTGLSVLDYTDTMLAEGGLPQWSIDEIIGLTEQWKIAKPVLEGIIALRRFVDARPRERLPLLAGVLKGDPAALERVTEKR